MSAPHPHPKTKRYRLWRFKRARTPPDAPLRSPPREEADLPHPSDDTDIHPEAYVPDREDFLPTLPPPPGPMTRLPTVFSIRPAALLLVICLLVSLGNWYEDGTGAGGTWASRETVFDQGQGWRLLLALFTHADLGHLLSNAPLFLIFGWYLRDFFGLAIFPGTALAIGVMSNALTLWTYPPDAQLLGASGMLYGMVALWLVLYVHFETAYSHAQRVFRAVGVSLLLLFPTTFHATTSYAAHGFGFVLGLVAGFAVTPFVTLRPKPEDPS